MVDGLSAMAVGGASAGLLDAVASRSWIANAAGTARAQPQPAEAPFDAASVRRAARAIADRPYQAAKPDLPKALAELQYDQYRAIRFVGERALWRGERLPFEAQLLHRGFLYKDRVDLYEVAQGRARPIRYAPELFTFGEQVVRPAEADLGFAGFRLHAPINRPDYHDEVCAFLGASYFRAVARKQIYGLSARGLSLKTGNPGGEEFPVFKAFWLERPQPSTGSVVVHALLDSPSAAAAFRFTIRPGETTVFDVEMALYPRVALAEPGIATMTSMFYFDTHDRVGIDDFRPAVHDSDGLAMWTGRDEHIWRPLANPADLQMSYFADANPRGFGLMQRERAFAGYEDLEARYERRPSLWVEPIGDWGEGMVQLVEIPTKGEIHDNIVAFWRPREALQAKGEYTYTYRLHWCWDNPRRNDLARVAKTRIGGNWQKDARLAVLDFAGDALEKLGAEGKPAAEVATSKGTIRNVVVQPNAEAGGWRLSFELPGDAGAPAELRARLVGDRAPLSETWLYRWAP